MVEDGRVRGLPAGASSGVPGCLGLLPLLEVGGQAAATHLEVLLHARPEGSPELASGAVVVSHALVGVSNVVLDRLHHALASVAVYLRSGRRD